MLAQKDAEEQSNLEELRAQARKEVAEWYARNEDQLNQTKHSNRCQLHTALLIVCDTISTTEQQLRVCAI